MLQPSQVPAYLLFLAFVIFLMIIFEVVFRWALQKRINEMLQSSEYSDQEVNAIRHQTLAMMIGLPLFLLFLVLSPLGWSLRHPFIYFLALALGFAPLIYISISSIQNHISIFRTFESSPVRGRKAVWKGVSFLAFTVLVFAVFVIYFISME